MTDLEFIEAFQNWQVKCSDALNAGTKKPVYGDTLPEYGQFLDDLNDARLQRTANGDLLSVPKATSVCCRLEDAARINKDMRILSQTRKQRILNGLTQINAHAAVLRNLSAHMTGGQSGTATAGQ